MKKMKKLLSLMLCLIMAVSTVSTLGFAEEEVTAVYGAESVGMLKVLGICDFTETDLLADITRADFLKIMATLAGYGATKDSVQLFSDLPLEDEREPYVRSLYNLGVITFGRDKKVYPDAKITLQEAITVAVKLAGYSVVAEAKGGYPSGYYNVAKQKGILKGIDYKSYTVVTNGMALKLAENTLKADLMIQTGFGDNVMYQETEGVNFLRSIYGVRHIEDVLTAVDISRVIGENDVPSEFIEIAGKTLEVRGLDMTSEELYKFLGYRVDVYYTEDRGDYAKVVYIEKNIKNSELLFDLDNVEYVANGRIKVYNEEGNKSKTYRFSSSIPIIYNGVSTGQVFSKSMIDGKFGTMRLVDNTGDGTTDLMILDVYENFVVSQVDSTTGVVYDKYSNLNNITVDTESDDPYVVVYDEEGGYSDIGAIGKDKVLAIYKSAPDAYQQFINIYVINSEVTGIITKTKDNKDRIVIDETEYKITAAAKTMFADLINLGENVKVKLDKGGRIAWMERVASADYKYGLVIAIDRGAGLTAKTEFVIYTNNDDFELFEAKDRILIDGETYDSSNLSPINARLHLASQTMYDVYDENGVLKKAVDASCIASVVRYKASEDGILSSIDTILNADTDALATREDLVTNRDDSMFMTRFTQSRFRKDYSVLGPNNILSKNAYAIFGPDPSNTVGSPTPDGDSIRAKENFRSGLANKILIDIQMYEGMAFYSSKTGYYADYIALNIDAFAAASISYRTKCSVVQEVYELYDEKTEEIVTGIKVITESGQKDLIIKKDKDLCVQAVDDSTNGFSAMMNASGLKKGDVITYTVDSNGYTDNIILYFRTDGRHTVSKLDTNYNWYGDRRHKFGYVMDKFENGLLVYFGTLETDTYEAIASVNPADVTFDQCEVISFADGDATFMAVEPGRGTDTKITLSSYDDLKSYKDTGVASIIFVQQLRGMPYLVYTFGEKGGVTP